MVFIVDGSEWQFDGMTSDDIERRIEDFISFVNVSDERDEAIQIGDDFQIKPMRRESSLWEMFGESSDVNLSGELRQEMAAWLGPVEYYADSDDCPEGVGNTLVAIDGLAAVDNPDVAWAHHCIRAGLPAACIVLSNAAVRQTVTDAGTAEVHFISDERSRRGFWRERIIIEGDSARALAHNAPHAYPDLCFVESVLAQVDDLAGGYAAFRGPVRAAFTALDDWGRWVFSCPPPALSPDEPRPVSSELPSNQIMERRFRGLGLTAAPENPNVRADRVSREARETVLNGRTLYCQWHVKLEPHRNRIHFHGPVPESGDRVVIGMIHQHLPLPG